MQQKVLNAITVISVSDTSRYPSIFAQTCKSSVLRFFVMAWRVDKFSLQNTIPTPLFIYDGAETFPKKSLQTSDKIISVTTLLLECPKIQYTITSMYFTAKNLNKKVINFKISILPKYWSRLSALFQLFDMGDYRNLWDKFSSPKLISKPWFCPFLKFSWALSLILTLWMFTCN